jgi:hypothetical protein
MTNNGFIFDNLNYSLATSQYNQTTDNIIYANHPIAGTAGLGNIQIFNSTPTEHVSLVNPGSQIIGVANTTNNSGRNQQWTTFGYNTTTQMANAFSAPARRSGFASTNSASNIYSANALNLFDSTLNWTVNGGSAPAPSITSVNPTIGTAAGGVNITITGNNFVYGDQIRVSGLDCLNINIINLTTINCDTPASTPGIKTIIITSPHTGDSNSVNFEYIAVPPLAINSVTPNTGPTIGGTQITIGGTSFEAGTTVTVGSNACSNITLINSSTITCITPIGNPGSEDVLVTNPNTETDILVAGFTYQGIITNGLSAFYDISNVNSWPGSGQTIFDLSGNNYNALLGSNDQIETADAAFGSESGLSYTALQRNQYKHISTSLPSNFSNSLTAEFWTRVIGASSAGDKVEERLFTQYRSGGSEIWDSRLALGRDNNNGTNSVQGLVENGSTDFSVVDTGFNLGNSFQNRAWDHVSITYDNNTSETKIYVNGVLQQSLIKAAGSPSNNPIKIGTWRPVASFWDGKHGDVQISKIRFYNRSLSQSEIDQNFNSEKEIFGLINTSINTLNYPTNASFGSISVSSSETSLGFTINDLEFIDRRQLFAPWTATLDITNLADGSKQINANRIGVNPGLLNVKRGSGNFTTPGVSGNFIGPTINRNLLVNSGANGGGSLLLSPSVQVSVPAFQPVGNYSANLRLSIF